MERYDTRIDGDTLFLEIDDGGLTTGDGNLEIGSMDDICTLLGGDSYTIDYDEEVRTAAWLQTDDDGTITFDVRDTIESIDYDDTFVELMAAESIDRTTAEGYPERTVKFADVMADIWDSKGTVDLESK